MTTEHVLCKFCDPPRRHPLGEPHIFASPEPKFLKPTPEKNRTAPPLRATNDVAKLPRAGVKGAERAQVDTSEWTLGETVREIVEELAATNPFETRADDYGRAMRRIATAVEEPCPECAMRRAKKAAQMQRWREKGKTK
jgi:hypothetical protein